jgi:hypothetical protein
MSDIKSAVVADTDRALWQAQNAERVKNLLLQLKLQPTDVISMTVPRDSDGDLLLDETVTKIMRDGVCIRNHLLP